MEKAKYSGPEKRKHKRLNKHFVVRIQIQGTKEWDIVLINNISGGGLLFSYDEELKEGMILNLKIDAALDKNTIYCVGKIVRVQTKGSPKIYEAGISFTEISGRDADLIGHTVEKFLLNEDAEGK